MRRLKIMVLAAVFGVSTAGSSYGMIYNYQVRNAFVKDGDNITGRQFYAYIVPTAIGRVTILVVDRRGRTVFVIANRQASIRVFGEAGNSGNVSFEALGLLDRDGTDEVDIALGRYKTRNGELSTMHLKGARTNRSWLQYGSILIRYNRALTKRAVAAGARPHVPADFIAYIQEIYAARGFVVIPVI